MNSTRPRCHECGRRLAPEYRFTFNRGLAVFLRELYRRGGPAKTDDLGLTYSQRTNSQKLRCWGLAEPYINEEARKKAGWWKITEKGKEFYTGRRTIPKFVFTRDGAVTKFDGPEIHIKEVCEGWEYREDYRQQIRQQAFWPEAR